jgi:hypothetical protein
VSDYNTSEFGLYDADSGSFYSSFKPPYNPQPFPALQLACQSQPPVPPPAPPVSPPVRLAAPVPHPASAVGFLRITTPDLQPVVPPPCAITDSPINYEAAALCVEQQVPTLVIPEPLEDQENHPPAPVICPPPCIGVVGPHPHQYFIVTTH